MPHLCTFTLLSTFTDGPLQIGVTTSGQGCKLSSRIRREIASSLPQKLGLAVGRLGSMRRRIWAEDRIAHEANAATHGIELDGTGHDDEDTTQPATFNKLILEKDIEAARTRRMRWLSQICEYWPLRRLAAITDTDVEAVLQAYASSLPSTSSAHITTNTSNTAPLDPHTLDARSKRGTIILAGSGPGHPSLLTLATHQAIKMADLILADKLVPSPILDLIPRRTPVQIARKFPGNADAAQQELQSLALAALKEGKVVLRLKQGDPYLYGRGAEELADFRAHGYPVTVLPGITSALSAPMFAKIPATHRGVSDQVLICTGTGRKGASPVPPTYNPTQTVVFLMALHRLDALVESLTGLPPCHHHGGRTAFPRATPTADEAAKAAPELVLADKLWPKETPCAIIERASCPDQRVIRSSLEWVGAAVQELGSRPPGLLVVGRSCEVLEGVEREGGRRWAVEEGFDLGVIEGMGLEGGGGLKGVVDSAEKVERIREV